MCVAFGLSSLKRKVLPKLPFFVSHSLRSDNGWDNPGSHTEDGRASPPAHDHSFLGYVREKQTSVLFKPPYSGASLLQQLSLHLNSYSCLHDCPLHLLRFWTQDAAQTFTIGTDISFLGPNYLPTGLELTFVSILFSQLKVPGLILGPSLQWLSPPRVLIWGTSKCWRGDMAGKAEIQVLS